MEGVPFKRFDVGAWTPASDVLAIRVWVNEGDVRERVELFAGNAKFWATGFRKDVVKIPPLI